MFFVMKCNNKGENVQKMKNKDVLHNITENLRVFCANYPYNN